MSGHTPGPWRVDFGNGAIYASHGGSFDCESELVERVATMRPTCVTDRWESDARLIVAAPDLLAALKCLLTDHVKCAESRTHGGPIEDAYAAIAKAEGRS